MEAGLSQYCALSTSWDTAVGALVVGAVVVGDWEVVGDWVGEVEGAFVGDVGEEVVMVGALVAVGEEVVGEEEGALVEV